MAAQPVIVNSKHAGPGLHEGRSQGSQPVAIHHGMGNPKVHPSASAGLRIFRTSWLHLQPLQVAALALKESGQTFRHTTGEEPYPAAAVLPSLSQG